MNSMIKAILTVFLGIVFFLAAEVLFAQCSPLPGPFGNTCPTKFTDPSENISPFGKAMVTVSGITVIYVLVSFAISVKGRKRFALFFVSAAALVLLVALIRAMFLA